MDLKTITLDEIHRSLGAKMVPFAGYSMPVQYESIVSEHICVRENVGVFDVSHMGEFLVSGEKALQLLQKLTTNDISKLSIGQAQYSCMVNEEGGIIDDLIIYRIKDVQYLLVVNAANIEKDLEWINSQNDISADIRNISDVYALLAVQGPKSLAVMQLLTPIKLSDIPAYHFEVGAFAGIEYVILSATGYTGSGGFEIYCKNTEVETIWNALLSAGKQYGIKPIGLAARDTLRLEKGFCLHGNDIDSQTTPLEAGLGWITKLNKNFIGKPILEKQKQKGVTKKLVGFELLQRVVPRKGYEIFDQKGNKIGVVTSGTFSPSLQKSIGMGYVSTENSVVGTNVYIEIRKNKVPATLVKRPFL